MSFTVTRHKAGKEKGERLEADFPKISEKTKKGKKKIGIFSEKKTGGGRN